MSAIVMKLITAEEFAGIPDPPDGSRHELVRGEVVIVSRPKGLRGILMNRIGRKIGNFVDERGLGWTVEDGGVVLERDPDTVRGPDVAFYSIQRQPLPPEDFFEIPPELAIEIRSPGDRPGRIREKVREYLSNGVRLIWIVDPGDRTVTVYSGKNRGIVYEDTDTLEGRDILPGFACKVSDLFV